LRRLIRHCLVALALIPMIAAQPARAVSLMNGGVLSMNGLNLTVSNCSLVLAGWQQSSCAAGNLVLQAVSGSRGTVSYKIVGSGTGSNGTDIFAAVGGGYNSGLYQLSFTLAVATNQTGSRVSGATLTTTGYDDYGCWLWCGSAISARQSFSAAAGGASLTSDLLSSPAVNTILTNANTFAINETVTMNSFGPEQYQDRWNPEALALSSVLQTFSTISEPAALIPLLIGVGGLVIARSRRPSRA
jgi:hypothetical protein